MWNGQHLGTSVQHIKGMKEHGAQNSWERERRVRDTHYLLVNHAQIQRKTLEKIGQEKDAR